MAVFNINQPQQRDGDGEWTPLATGQYLMQIAEAKIAPSKFANDEGKFPEQLSITWKLAEWTQDYAEAGYQEGQKVFQQFNPWYGESKKGPSKFKMFIDPLIAEELIPPQFEIAELDMPATEGDLIGITRRVMVELYAKTMGANKGQPGNKVLAVTSPKPFRTTAKEAPVAPRSPSKEAMDGMTQQEMVDYAKHLAQQAGSFWAKKSDWAQQPIATLQGNIRRMEAAINETPVATGATDDELPF